MSRTDQAHSWVIYFVLVLVSVTVCYSFLFTDKLASEAFVGIAVNVIMFFFGKKVGSDGNGASTPAAPPQPPTG